MTRSFAVRWYSALEEEGHYIAQANAPIDPKTGKLQANLINARYNGEPLLVAGPRGNAVSDPPDTGNPPARRQTNPGATALRRTSAAGRFLSSTGFIFPHLER